MFGAFLFVQESLTLGFEFHGVFEVFLLGKLVLQVMSFLRETRDADGGMTMKGAITK